MPISRKKSCARCRQSKLRCNLDAPSCSQCTRRRLKCVYDGRDSDRVAPYSFPASTTSTAAISVPSLPVDTSASITAFENPHAISGTVTSLATTAAEDDSLLDFGGGELPFDWLTVGRPAYSGLESPKSFDIDTVELPYVTPRDLFYGAHNQQGFAAALVETEAQHSRHSTNINLELSERNTRGALGRSHDVQLVSTAAPSDQKILRRRIFLKDCVLTSVVLGQLTGYPRMMIEGELLPPFIQAPCHYDEEQAPECRVAGRHKCLPEILAICASLVEMFYSRTQANEQFVWKMIYVERARLRKKFFTFDRHDQLAAIQSVTVFMLLQAGDAKTVERNDAGSLLGTAMEFIVNMSNNYMWRPDSSKVRPARREWAFHEAHIRIGSIFCIIDLLLEGMHPPEGHTCEEGAAFPQSILPCSRDLWEARSTSRWIVHYERYMSRGGTDQELRGHRLLEAKLSSDHSGIRSSCMGPPEAKGPDTDVLRWCEGLDTLGTLIWMVVPLYRYRIEQGRERMAGYVNEIEHLDRLHLFELLQSRSFQYSSSMDSAANFAQQSTAARKSLVERLPSELLSLIFKCEMFSQRDMLAFGLSSTYLWQHFLHASVGRSDVGALSRTPFFCIGNYLEKFPKRLRELYPRLKDNESWPPRGVSARFAGLRPARQWLYNTLDSSDVLLDEGALHTWVNILSSITNHGIDSCVMQKIERSLRHAAKERDVGAVGQKWFLRNLKTSEYVRLEASVEPDETGNDRYDWSPEDESGAAKIARGDEVARQADGRELVATVESAPWLSLDTGLFFLTMYPMSRTEDEEDSRESPWVGHEFDILSEEQWQDFEHGEWTDATDKMIDASVDLRKSVFENYRDYL
ncbi:hypothetical protein PWT90_08494 [Aphanocladium album]|nr:hypothetical protein PWT90_08494 [Aphanocladium album]